MITARVEHGDGRLLVEITGHADTDTTCAAVTAIEQAFLLALEQYALLCPSDLQIITSPEGATP